MKQQLVQVQEQLSALERVCPVWFERFKSIILNDHVMDLLYHKNDRCVVGEAWGFTNDYVPHGDGSSACGECFAFAISIPLHLEDRGLHAARLEANRFARHFEKVHMK